MLQKLYLKNVLVQQELEKQLEKLENLLEENLHLRVLHFQENLQIAVAKMQKNVKFILLRETQLVEVQNKEEIEDFKQFFLYGEKCLMLKKLELIKFMEMIN